MSEKTDVFREKKVHVKFRRCATCIIRDANLMDLQPGGVAKMIEQADETHGCIPCHETTHQGGNEAVCRGYFDRRSSMMLRLAVKVGIVEFV